MNLQEMLGEIKARPDFHRVGMIACHNGIVRGHSRRGRAVIDLTVEVDWSQLENILAEMRLKPGIVDVKAHLFEGYREVGEDLMLLAVAGDIREHVLPVLEEFIERVKRTVTKKEERYAD